MKKLIILLTTLLILQGCSSKGDISTEQLQNLTNSVSISQLEKTEFNKKDNKLVITTNEEVITKEGFETLLKSLKLNNFNGKTVSVDAINSNEFNKKDFNIVIVTKNNNTATFSVKDSVNKSFEISNKKYSKDFMKNKLTAFSKELLSLDELAGTIQTDLDKGRSLGDKVDKFKDVTEKVNVSMLTLKSLSNDTIEYGKLDEVKQKVQRLEALTKNVVTAVNTSVESKKGTAIDAAFLNINDIDKIARDLTAM
jgi:putative leucine-rich repeat-containing protein